MEPRHTLVIGDGHIWTKESDPTFRWLALRREILTTRPDTIVFMGDLIEMASLSKYDMPGSLEKENMRIADEVALARATLEYVVFVKKGWPKNYSPEVILIEGNHEYRLKRLISQDAIFDGILSIENELCGVLINNDLVNVWVPYGEYIVRDQIAYTHIPFKSGQPVASVINSTGMVLQLLDKSVVYGHTHRLEVKQLRRQPSKKLITALNVGCFFSHIPGYVKTSNPPWWRGIVHIYPDGEGGFDFKTRSLEAML